MKEIYIFNFVCFLLYVCQAGAQVEMYPEMTNRLMSELGKGVTGGDGCLSVDLKNGKSLFLWGDSFLGDVVDNRRTDPSPMVVGNMFTLLSSDTAITYFRGTREKPSSWLQPDSRGDTVCFYWPGHGFVRDGILHLFMHEYIKTGNSMFDFRFVCCDYFRLNAQTLETIDRQNFPAANV